MSEVLLHVVFSPSGAGVVRQLLRRLGRRDRVIVPCGNLMYGPINDIDGQQRREWLARHIDGGHDASNEEFDLAWAAVLSASASPIAWFMRGNPMEYCGFLEFVDRLGDKPFDVVDVHPTEVQARAGRRFALRALSETSLDQMVDFDLLQYRRRLQPAEVDRYRALWRALKADNAPLRLLQEDRLVSAPLDALDAALLLEASQEWTTSAFVVGSAMVALMDRDIRVGDGFLFGRVRALSRSGAIELETAGDDVSRSRIRLPEAKL